MRLRCANVGKCTNIIDFNKSHTKIGEKHFCSSDCACDFQQQSLIFLHALEGRPTLGRKPGRERRWYERDG